MVADALAVVDAEAAPALAFGRFEALEEVEEGERGGGVGGGAGGEGGEDWRTSVPVQSLVVLLYEGHAAHLLNLCNGSRTGFRSPLAVGIGRIEVS